jgi:hypothetical protein
MQRKSAHYQAKLIELHYYCCCFGATVLLLATCLSLFEFLRDRAPCIRCRGRNPSDACLTRFLNCSSYLKIFAVSTIIALFKWIPLTYQSQRQLHHRNSCLRLNSDQNSRVSASQLKLSHQRKTE